MIKVALSRVFSHVCMAPYLRVSPRGLTSWVPMGALTLLDISCWSWSSANMWKCIGVAVNTTADFNMIVVSSNLSPQHTTDRWILQKFIKRKHQHEKKLIKIVHTNFLQIFLVTNPNFDVNIYLQWVFVMKFITFSNWIKTWIESHSIWESDELHHETVIACMFT